MRKVLFACLVPALVGGCAVTMLPQDRQVQASINTELQKAGTPQVREAAAPVPSAVSGSLLPPLRTPPPRVSARQLEQRFDLKVNDAPIGQVLLAVVQDTPYSILLTPKAVPAVQPLAAGGTAAPAAVSELLTVNLKDVTVFEALDAIREMYGYEYVVDGTRVYVQPPELRTRLYQVNYILGQRRGVSDVQVIGGASTGSSAGGGGGGGATTSGGGGSSYASVQASALSSISKSDVWGEMEDGVRTILSCQIARSVPLRATGVGAGGGVPGSSTGAGGSSGGNSSRADVSFVGDTQTGERLRGVDGCPGGRALTVNQMSGIVVVKGLPRELRQVEEMLRYMQLNIERQVIIEAKVIDVELNAGSQQGINWAGLQQGRFAAGVGATPGVIDATSGATRGQITAGTTLGDLLGSQLLGVPGANAFSAGLGVALQFSNFSALLNFLQTQGNVQVLSSPRIATLNNQKAVLKVGSEESFVTSISGGNTREGLNGSLVLTPPTLGYQPFFSGISLDVTPQVDENDNITLHVHSMVNSIIEKEKLAVPTGAGARVPFAVNNISETDSVVKARDGQVIVIGGLMSESSNDSRARVPGAGDVPIVGALFGRSSRQTTKRELVILLKSTVVKDESAWLKDVNSSRSRIDAINGQR